MAPAMAEEVNVIIMVIQATIISKSNVRKSHMKIANTLKFQEMYLKPNATTSKFPNIPEYRNKNVTMLRCLSIPKYLNKAATMLRCPNNPEFLTKNATMQRCQNVTKFQRNSVTPAHTNLERGTAAATAATVAAIEALTVVRPKSTCNQ